MRALTTAIACRSPRRRKPVGGGAAAAALLVLFAGRAAAFQDTVVRDDFQTLRGAIERVDASGVQLSGGDVVPWYRVVAVDSPSRGAEVDAWLERVARPLQRARWRLAIGDRQGAAELAEPLAEEYASRQDATAALLRLIRFEARAADNPLDAAADYLGLLDRYREHPAWREDVPESLGWPRAIDRELHPQMLPMWDDRARAAAVWETVREALGDRSPGELALSQLVVVASIASIAEGSESPARWLEELQRRAPAWRQVIDRQRVAVGAGSAAEEAGSDESWPLQAKAVGRYGRGRIALASSLAADAERGSVELLAVAALYGDDFPELAADALDRVARQARAEGDERAAERLYNEIHLRFDGTRVARRLTERP